MPETGNNLSFQDIHGLSIQLDLDGLSFVCPGQTRVQTHSFPHASANPDIVLDNLTRAFRETPALTARYPQCSVVLPTRKFTWVPLELFRPEKAKDLLHAMHPLDELDEVNTYVEERVQAACLYALPADITAKVTQFQKNSLFLASILPCVRFLMDRPEPSRALIFFSYDTSYLVMAQQDRLLLANAYPGTHSLSALYFLLLALKQWQMNPQSLRLYVGGKDLSAKEKAQLSRYIPSLQPVPAKETILMSLCAS